MNTDSAHAAPAIEHIPVSVYPSSKEAVKAVAAELATLIRRRQAEHKGLVVGLATGSTPIGFYTELIRLHREEGLSFHNVTSFNLDEYHGLSPDHAQSYHRFMRQNLFDHIDIPSNQIHLPSGLVPESELEAHCANYEEMIREAGGIDFQILGIGRTGHIGFNEPGSPRRSLTRMVTLDPLTRRDAAADFGGEPNTPRKAITMGIRTILNARRVILMAWGQHKADIVCKAVEGEVTSQVSASFLQEHENATFILDAAAASALTRTRTPWCLGPLSEQGLRWDEGLTRRAVLWLARSKRKAILKLTDEDYNGAGLQDLLQTHGSAYEANLFGFYALQHTITGWPGGRDPRRTKSGDAPVRPLKSPSAEVFPKRILILSPHPDDDVFSMGGTLCRLVEQGHDVRIAHQVSGFIAVPNEALASALDFADHAGLAKGEELARIRSWTQAHARGETPAETQETRRWKTLIRQHEALAAARTCGVSKDKVHFLQLPMYNKEDPRRRKLGMEDVVMMQGLLNSLKPHLIFAAGDLEDPHGTHRLCLQALRDALCFLEKESWVRESELWLYRGTWTEFPVDEIDMAVPLSPREMLRRRQAVFCHRTQKDLSVMIANQEIPLWKRAEERCRQLACAYNELGLAEYEAIEAFRRYSPERFIASGTL